MREYIAATFNNYNEADKAVDALMSRGYDNSRISVITREDIVRGNVAISKGDTGSGISKAAATGGVIGGLVGLLTGIGALAIPGIGPLLIAGPVATVFGLGATAAATTSGAVTGLLAGGLVGALKELGFDEMRAKQVEDKVKAGDVLLLVDVTNDDDDAPVKDVLKNNAGEDITELSYKGA